MPSRPEFHFYAQSDVLTAKFSEFHNNYIVGGMMRYSFNIQAHIRARYSCGIPELGIIRQSLLTHAPFFISHNPVLKSPLSGQGHAHPVFSLQVVGSANANQLISASTDGLVCSWQLDRLAQPLV